MESKSDLPPLASDLHLCPTMRLLATLLLAFAFLSPARAEEGMWLPLLLKQLNEGDMHARGMKLSADDIYAINKSSLKDAVVLFNGGCTGEIIGREGLLLTNHHCGFGQIQSHSKVGQNYLDDGFWAMSKAEELQNPGTTAAILQRMEDVTNAVNTELAKISNLKAQQEALPIIYQKLIATSTEGTHYKAIIKPLFYGSQHYLFVYEIFTDVRLVGAPPSGIGKFGGDTDNWVWPRHTGDFSLFRIYTGPDGKPAEPAAANIPYTPKKFFKLNLSGIKEGDFSMVMGFPGRTQEYLTSHGVSNVAVYSNPYKVALRAKRLAIIDKYSKESEAVRIQYAAKQASMANYWKKWAGESRGLTRLHTIENKQAEERQLTAWMQADPQRLARYGHVLPHLDSVYQVIDRYTLPVEYYREAAQGTEIIGIAMGLMPAYEDLVKANDKTIGSAEQLVAKSRAEEALKTFEQGLAGFYKNYHAPLDKEWAVVCLTAYKKDIPADLQPERIRAKSPGELADGLFAKTRLMTEAGARALVADIRKKGLKALQADEAAMMAQAFRQMYVEKLMPPYQAAIAKLEPDLRRFTEARREAEPNRKFYPDANLTLRVTYGPVAGYRPADGVTYLPFTYLDGVIEKRDTTVEEFNAPRRLVDLYHKKDYGRYADKEGRLPLAFAAANHTTGGNSGSPVIDAHGRLIGTNFDRCWEGTMSDIDYDADQCRNIAVDIRYTLWVVDKFAGAGYLLKEMEVE